MQGERKYERDIDLLLAEEFRFNPEFAAWFLAQTKFAGDDAKIVDAHVSKADSLGESDLVIVLQRTAGERIALFIEDKIDAPLQPEQAGRYRSRAERDARNGLCSDFEIILCAPRHYLETRSDLSGFDRKVAYEDMGGALAACDPSPRGAFRAEFIATAASRRSNSWSREEDETTNRFWDSAYDIATREFPVLEMKRPQLTKGSNWIEFRPRDMRDPSKRVYISLKGSHGFVDLTFSHTTAHLFGERIGHLLEDDMRLLQTSGAASIRLEIAKFAVTDELGEGMAGMRVAFAQARRLVLFFRTHQVALKAAAQQATPL